MGLLRRLEEALITSTGTGGTFKVFQSFSEDARDDVELGRRAVEQDPFCLQIVGPTCKRNKVIVGIATEKQPDLLQYADITLREDLELVRKVVAEDSWCFKHAGEKCRDDPEFVRE